MPIDTRLIRERFVRAPGPGGQNVNKVATAVELRFDANAAGFTDDVMARLRRVAGTKMTADGVVVIHAHEHRTQKKNREAARARLEALLARASKRPRSRRPTKAPAIAVDRRIDAKHRRGALKKMRATKRGDD
jgi:ribosome-associated protein